MVLEVASAAIQASAVEVDDPGPVVREKVPEVPLIVPVVPDVEIAASDIESVAGLTDPDVEELGVLGGACAAEGPIFTLTKGPSSKLGTVPENAMVAGSPRSPASRNRSTA